MVLRFKRLATALLAILIVMSAAACGQGTADTTTAQTTAAVTTAETTAAPTEAPVDFKGMKITLANVWGKDLTATDDTTQRWVKRIEEVEKKYNVDFEWIKVDEANYWDTMIANIMAGTSVGDLLFSHTYTFTPWVKAGAVADVGSLGVADFNDGTWNKSVIEATTFNGKVYGFHKEVADTNSGILFNKKLFADAGLEDPYALIEKNEWNFDKLRDYAKKLTKDTDGDGKTDQWGFSSAFAESIPLSMITSAEATMVDYSGDIPRLNLEGPKEMSCLQLFYDMVNVDKSTLAQVGVEWDTHPKLFVQGKIAMFRCEQWIMDWVALQEGKPDFGYAYFPKGAGAGNYYDDTYVPIYFIPSTLDIEKQKAALTVFGALFDSLYPEYSPEENVRIKAETWFSDEKAVEIFSDIVLNNRWRSNQAAKSGINDEINALLQDIASNKGTPQSLVSERKAALQAKIEDSAPKK